MSILFGNEPIRSAKCGENVGPIMFLIPFGIMGGCLNIQLIKILLIC